MIITGLYNASIIKTCTGTSINRLGPSWFSAIIHINLHVKDPTVKKAKADKDFFSSGVNDEMWVRTVKP